MAYYVTVDCYSRDDAEILLRKFAESGLSAFAQEGLCYLGNVRTVFRIGVTMVEPEIELAKKKFRSIYGRILGETGLGLDGKFMTYIAPPDIYVK